MDLTAEAKGSPLAPKGYTASGDLAVAVLPVPAVPDPRARLAHAVAGTRPGPERRNAALPLGVDLRRRLEPVPAREQRRRGRSPPRLRPRPVRRRRHADGRRRRSGHARVHLSRAVGGRRGERRQHRPQEEAKHRPGNARPHWKNLIPPGKDPQGAGERPGQQ